MNGDRWGRERDEIKMGRKRGRGWDRGEEGGNRVEIEPTARAEEWSCAGAGEKKGMGKGKGENQLSFRQHTFRQQLMLAQPQQLWRALNAFLFCCCPKGLCCSTSQLYQQVFILHLFS